MRMYWIYLIVCTVWYILVNFTLYYLMIIIGRFSFQFNYNKIGIILTVKFYCAGQINIFRDALNFFHNNVFRVKNK